LATTRAVMPPAMTTVELIDREEDGADKECHADGLA
jgi:hypothetical protein